MVGSHTPAERTAAGRRLFGEILRGHRAAANLTQEELAERSGLSVHAISMLERGVRLAPRASTVELLANALELDASQRQVLVVAARTQPEPDASMSPDPASLPVRCDDGAVARTAPVWRRWLPGRWWPVLALQGLLVAMLLIALVAGNVWARPPAPSASPSASSLPRCTTPGHPKGCWATVSDAGIDPDPTCPHQVPLYVRTGGHVCLARDDLVEIVCYYSGKPSVGGDQFQDHVVEEDAGRLLYVGHIPDRFVALEGSKPSALGIHRCSAPAPKAR